MIIDLHALAVSTTAPIQVLDITEDVRGLLEQSNIETGLLTVQSNHTTAFLNINENEMRLHQDMIDFLMKLAPCGAGYGHDIDPVDDRANAHAHLAGLFMNASQSIAIAGGRLLLGTWQSILFIELDGPRELRTLQVQIMGQPKA